MSSTGEKVYRKQLKNESDAGEVQVEYLQYPYASEYWKYVNFAVKSSAMDDYFSQLRGFLAICADEDGEHVADQPKGRYRADISEFFRDGELVSLKSSYCGQSGSAHGWRGVDSMNFGGSDCGSFTLVELFGLDESQALQIIKHCDKILKLDGGKSGVVENMAPVSLADEIDGTLLTATEMLEHFNFNDRGIVLNFGSAVGLPSAMGEFEVTVPWTAWVFKISEPYQHTQVAKFINRKRGGAH